MESRNIQIHGIDFLLKIHYEQRKNCRVSIRKNTINVRISSSLSSKEQAYQLEKLIHWARKHVEENPDKFRPLPQKRYVDGDNLTINDKTYVINIAYKDKKHSSARVYGDTISLCLSKNSSEDELQKDIASLLSRCIGQDQLPKLKQKIYYLNEKYFNKEINNIYFKNNLSNWGSCSQKGNINISTRVLFAPDDVLEYVCIHELAHLIEPNHSEQFWQLVRHVMPQYKEKIQWLKENADTCRF